MPKYEWDLNQLRILVKESINFTEVLNKMNIPVQGNNSKTLQNILDQNQIDYSHFTGRARHYKTNYVSAAEYLNNNKKIKSSKLKNKLLKEKLIAYECSICGLSQWLDKPLVLQLHHKDGNPNNNCLDNLQLLCPNCHSQTDNYCGNANTVNITHCRDCGAKIHVGSVYCTTCARKHRRKVLDRPGKEQLLQDFKDLKSFVKIGQKYGVSDNTLRKWYIAYGLPGNAKELKKHVL